MAPKHLPNILIVDDIEENLDLLEAVIKNISVNIIRALSGAEALEKTRGIDLILAIIDVSMPEMNGYDLAVKLNLERKSENVPVIFLTANIVERKNVFKGYNAGAVDYLFKPISNVILLSKINVFLDLFNQKQTIISHSLLLTHYADKLTTVNKAIKKSEKKYRNYIDNAPDGIFVVDETGRYVEVNKATSRITGYSESELLNMSISNILPDESLQENMIHLKTVLKSGTLKADLPFRHKDGSKRWWALEAVKLSKTKFLGFAKDITMRKKAEEELQNSLEQLHQLTQYIDKVREAERVAISRDLHDDLGQALTAVKIDLGIIRQQVSDTEVALKISKVSALVSETIKTVQRLTSELRPQIIDDLGLEAAIEWYTTEFANRNGMEIFLNMDSGISIAPDASLTLFRIMQESLTNIARHSKATRVEIGLEKNADFIDFRISDNGIGISENDINSKKSFGIMSMKERAASLGGNLDIFNNNDHGTIIKLILPVKI